MIQKTQNTQTRGNVSLRTSSPDETMLIYVSDDLNNKTNAISPCVKVLSTILSVSVNSRLQQLALSYSSVVQHAGDERITNF